jgi:hypothetical protein
LPPTTSPEPGPVRASQDGSLPPGARLRLGRLARLWGELTLGGILLITLLTLWHLRRRARLVRDRLGPPRARPDLDPGQPGPRSDDL